MPSRLRFSINPTRTCQLCNRSSTDLSRPWTCRYLWFCPRCVYDEKAGKLDRAVRNVERNIYLADETFVGEDLMACIRYHNLM